MLGTVLGARIVLTLFSAVNTIDKNPCCDGAYIPVVCAVDIIKYISKLPPSLPLSLHIYIRSDKSYGENQGWRKEC